MKTLVASPRLSEVLENALCEVPATCVGCGCTDNNACMDEFYETCHWLKVNRQTGLGVCSFCPEFLSHPLTDDDGEKV